MAQKSVRKNVVSESTQQLAAPVRRNHVRPNGANAIVAEPSHGEVPSLPPARINSLRKKLPKSKQFVALAGNIGAGKTTAAKLLSHAFGMELFDEPVIDNRFLKDYYADM